MSQTRKKNAWHPHQFAYVFHISCFTTLFGKKVQSQLLFLSHWSTAEAAVHPGESREAAPLLRFHSQSSCYCPQMPQLQLRNRCPFNKCCQVALKHNGTSVGVNKPAHDETKCLSTRLTGHNFQLLFFKAPLCNQAAVA